MNVVSLCRNYVWVVAFAAAAVGQQRPVRQISNPGFTVHREAVISPDGLSVAYLGASAIGTVNFDGSGQRETAASSVATAPVWRADSTEVLYGDGAQVRAVARIGGSVRIVGNVPGTAINVWSTDSTDTTLFGTRYDAPSQTYFIFELPVAGGVPQDLVSSQDVLSHVRPDPTDTYLVYKAAGTVPFSPVEFFRADRDGQNPIALSGGGIGTNAESPFWLDVGDTVAYVGLDPVSTSFQVLRLDRTTQAIRPWTGAPLTHMRATVSLTSGYIAFSAVDGVAGNGPAIMPIGGGGHVFLAPNRGFQYTGNVTIDDRGARVVFSAVDIAVPNATSQIYRIDLDREMIVAPRAEPGVTVAFDMPAAVDEVGVLLLGVQVPNPAPLLPVVNYDMHLDTNFLILTIARPDAVGTVATGLFLPPIQALRTLRLHFQGIRWNDGAQTGEMTRHGEMYIF